MGTKTVGMTVTFLAGAGKMVGSFLMLEAAVTLDGACVMLDGLGGAGRMAGRGLDLTCVVTVGADRLGVIWVGHGLMLTVVRTGAILLSFLEVTARVVNPTPKIYFKKYINCKGPAAFEKVITKLLIL